MIGGLFRMKYFSAICVAALLAAAPAAASAATAVVNVTMDLTQSGFAPTGFTYAQGSPSFSPSTISVDLAEGDTLDFTIDFLGLQQLTLTNPNMIWGLIYATSSSNVTGTGTLSLLDTGGNVILASGPKTDTEGAVHFGQYFYGPDFAGGLPSSLTFGGLHYVGTVDDYVDPATTSRTYTVAGLVIDSGANSYSVAAGVPEPAAWTVMLLGMVGLGAALRSARRRSTMLAA